MKLIDQIFQIFFSDSFQVMTTNANDNDADDDSSDDDDPLVIINNDHHNHKQQQQHYDSNQEKILQRKIRQNILPNRVKKPLIEAHQHQSKLIIIIVIRNDDSDSNFVKFVKEIIDNQ